jgi:hypothetical protein
MQNSRIVRRQYRTILTNIQDQQLELRETTSKLTQKIIDANHLFETVQNAQDATMDATLLLTTAEYASEKISKISAGKQKISLDEFVSLVNWDLVTVTSKAIFPCGFMYFCITKASGCRAKAKSCPTAPYKARQGHVQIPNARPADRVRH